MARLFTVSNSIKEISPANGKRFTLEELQGYVGGDIEYLTLSTGEVMVMNVDGNPMGLKRNDLATAATLNVFNGHNPSIVGDVLVAPKKELPK